MICPKWVAVLAQPIAIEDVLSYLLESVQLPERGSTVFEIGGPDQVSYGEIMREMRGSVIAPARDPGLRADAVLIEFVARPGNAFYARVGATRGQH